MSQPDRLMEHHTQLADAMTIIDDLLAIAITGRTDHTRSNIADRITRLRTRAPQAGNLILLDDDQIRTWASTPADELGGLMTESIADPPPAEPKRMDLAEFRSEGYLQEANRLFFHPLGLALEVIVDGADERLGGIWDYRDDPEGIVFWEPPDADRADLVERQRQALRPAREKLLGSSIQPATTGGEGSPCGSSHA